MSFSVVCVPSPADDEPATKQVEEFRPLLWKFLNHSRGSDFGLLHGMVRRLDEAIGRRASETRPVDHEDGEFDTEIVIGIKLDRATKNQPIWVGFFKQARWSEAEPAYVRQLPGAGVHRVRGLKPGRYYLGAMMGRYPEPDAVGVYLGWPKAIEVSEGSLVRVRLMMSRRFLWHARSWGDSLQDAGPAPSRLVQVTDDQRRPVPYCEVQLADGSGHQEIAVETDTSGLGFFKNDDDIQTVNEPLLATTICTNVDPSLCAMRFRIERTLHQPPITLPMQLSARSAPTGAAVLNGQVLDQHGQAVTEYRVHVLRCVTGRIEPPGECFAHGLWFPVANAEGRYHCPGLPAGTYRVSITPLDYRTHLPKEQEVTVTEAGDIGSILDFRLEARERFYVMLLNEEGTPFKNIQVLKPTLDPWRDLTQENPFCFFLSQRERQALIDESAGLLLLFDGSLKSSVGVNVLKLSQDPANPTVVTWKLPDTTVPKKN